MRLILFLLLISLPCSVEAQLLRHIFGRSPSQSSYTSIPNGYRMYGKDYIRGVHPGRPGCSCSMCQDLNYHYQLARSQGQSIQQATSTAYTKASSLPRETPMDAREIMLRLAKLQPGDYVIDPGCAHGTLLIEASLNYKVSATGIEINPQSAETARRRVSDLNLPILIVTDDCKKHGFQKADVVFLYLFPQLIEELESHFKAMKSGSRIVSYHFPLPNATIHEESGHIFYIRRN